MLTVKPLRYTNTLWLGYIPAESFEVSLQWDRSTNIWLAI